MKYNEKLFLDCETLVQVRKLLNTIPSCPEACMGEEETITYTIKFENEIEMDIKICGVKFMEGEANLPWTEAVLFKGGSEFTCSEPSDEIEGEWSLQAGEDEYTVLVMPDLERSHLNEGCR